MDERKRESVDKATSMEDVLKTVAAAQTIYENSKQDSKMRERLRRFTKVVHYYGNIMDMLVQHHPEYVALAWGSMKFLLVTFLNHDATISALAKGLCKIGNALPRLQLAAVLYPTARMKRAIAELYAHIMKFLIRAHNWFQETRLQHAWHAISRPAEIRYEDLIEEIEMRSQIIEGLTVAGGQAEQRVMHKKLDAERERVMALEAEMREIKMLLISFQSMASGAFINTNQRLSDLQLSNILDYLVNVPLLEPSKALKRCLLMRERRQLRQKVVPPDYTWLTPRLQRWSESQVSSLIIVRGRFQSRFEMKDLSAGLVQVLQNAGAPVMWVLKAGYGCGGESAEQPSAIDLVKYLVLQALRVAHSRGTEAFAASICARFRTALTEADWLSIFGSVLEAVPEVYILIDVETVNLSPGSLGADFWPSAFLGIFSEMARRGCKTRVKVGLITYGSGILEPEFTEQAQGSRYLAPTVRAPAHTQSTKNRKGKRWMAMSMKIAQRNYGLQLSP
ncbi:hypothetical protein K469DRAFT_3844 [Zopfia rhizophila CBS 207.26]|uniref:DUF7708 domain-containing protein n=1 Tax=Zopfia rhizophila CBS 207.26 TaxID=1314779 RepID=A0A6A6EVT8_9PEZI|nr:hypothetical protein K469DRAFT_3844 [Zopfia rhizophila CBS 207.26]